MRIHRLASSWLPVCLTLAAASPALQAEEILLFDDFDGTTLNGATWGLANWNIGDRTQFGNQPEFVIEGETSFIRLPLDTWNPNLPGERVFGTEIYSLQNFAGDASGIEYLTRARLNENQGGLVAAFFTYNQLRRKGRWISDEIDFEVLSNRNTDQVLVTSWNDWGTPGSDYEDGIHHAGEQLTLQSFNWQEWNTYAMRWYPDRIEWWINGVKVHEQIAPVPDQPQPVRASLWAAGTTWGDAFDSTLAPVSSESANVRYHWDVDLIAVTRLGEGGGGGGGGGGEQPPAAPSGLAASVAGSTVQLSWVDNATNETGYTVYRAWKPKGNALPDFKLVASLGANAAQHADLNVPNGEHLYRVTAANGAAQSTPSNTVGVTVGTGGKGKP